METLYTKMSTKLQSLAGSMQSTIDQLELPHRENTPKRQKEGAYRRIEAAHMRRAQTMLNVLAEFWAAGLIPDDLKSINTKKEVLSITRTRLDNSGGYYSIRDTGDYCCQQLVSVEARKFVELHKTVQQNHDEAEARRLSELRELENSVKFSNIDGFFPTPPDLARSMARNLMCQPGMDVLEPSAGKGDLADAVRDMYGDSLRIVQCVEIKHTLAKILQAKQHECYNGDFLKIVPSDFGLLYDRIIMNPPFENNQDMEHVAHAYRFLKPGGRLIALMSPRFQFHKGQTAVQFRAKLHGFDLGNWELEQLGEAFKGSDTFRQTGVNVIRLTIHKPGTGAEHHVKLNDAAAVLVQAAPDVDHDGVVGGTILSQLQDAISKLRLAREC